MITNSVLIIIFNFTFIFHVLWYVKNVMWYDNGVAQLIRNLYIQSAEHLNTDPVRLNG